MIKKVDFKTNKNMIADYRKKSYNGQLKQILYPYDSIARHFLIHDMSNEMIGMFRIILSDNNKFEIDDDKAKLNFQKFGLGIEISRLCISNSLKNKICIKELFKFFIEYSKENHIDYVIAGSKPSLLKLYKRFGSHICGEEYTPRNFTCIHYPIVITWKTLIL